MFRIIWMPRAFDRMSEIVRANPDRRDEFAEALRSLSTELRENPAGAGESRDDPFRVGFFDPLTVTFRVSPGQQTVYITDVHLPE